jgi:DNA modification methylase
VARLIDNFIVPPFSVLDSKQGYWQKRKNFWINKGIKSELGRKVQGNLSFERLKDMKNQASFGTKAILKVGGQSIFDPVLTEVMYEWFCPTNGKILDPFAGGSVRGIVANFLDREYVGLELRKEQVDSNIEQAKTICDNGKTKWITGDSDKELDKITEQFDHIWI